MADTVFVNRASRFGADTFLVSGVAAVAVDAAFNESFFLPTTFGEILIKWAAADISSLSGAYVAPAPAFDGLELYIVSADLTTRIDGIGTKRFVNASTVATRPELRVSFEDVTHPILLRQRERLMVSGPIIGGAGVTAVVNVYIRGIRFKSN